MRTAFSIALALAVAACSAPRSPSPAKVVHVGAASDAPVLSIEGPGSVGTPRRRPARLAVSNTLCLARADGSVRCIGELAPGGGGTAKRVIGLPPVAEIALGNALAYARTSRGEVWCWGRPFARPTSIAGLSEVVQIAAATDDYACARRRDGKVSCWGTELTPAVVTGLENVVDVALWSDNACATTADGRVLCWRERDPTPRAETTGGDVTSNLDDVLDVALGGLGTSVRMKDGRLLTSPLHCTTLSHGFDPKDMVAERPPHWAEPADGGWVLVPDVTNVASVSGGAFSACATSTDGRVRCWGCDAKPAVVPDLVDAEEVAMDITSTCVRVRDDSVVCWGVNAAVSSASPTRVDL